MRVEERLAPWVIEEIRAAIIDAGGNEVFLVGRMGDDGRVESVIVGARGNEEAVPVLSPHMAGGDAILHNHPGGDTDPSEADLAVASRLGNQGIGFYILDNDVTEIYVVAEPVKGREIQSLAEEELAGLLAPGGALSRIYPLFEERESQALPCNNEGFMEHKCQLRPNTIQELRQDNTAVLPQSSYRAQR